MWPKRRDRGVVDSRDARSSAGSLSRMPGSRELASFCTEPPPFGSLGGGSEVVCTRHAHCDNNITCSVTHCLATPNNCFQHRRRLVLEAWFPSQSTNMLYCFERCPCTSLGICIPITVTFPFTFCFLHCSLAIPISSSEADHIVPLSSPYFRPTHNIGSSPIRA